MSLEITTLPTLNALINLTTTLLLLRGWWLIRQRRIAEHRRAMLGALAGSAVFLVSYLIYHFEVGSVKFQGTGAVRTIYFAILLSHTVLAACVPVLALITVSRALRARFERHKAIARWTLPIWLYVSVTGVIVYLMLYRIEWS